MNCQDLETVVPLYLSGELDAPRVADFRAHLAVCPACAAELAGQVNVDSRLRAALFKEAFNSEPLEGRIRHSIATRRRLRVAAGIAALLVFAFLGARIWTSVRVNRTYADAARDHHREVVDQQPRAWLSDPPALDALAVQQGLSPSALARLTEAGYNLERGKLCRLNGRVYLHMVYARNGQQFSLFLRQRGEPFPHNVTNADRGPEHLASFQTDLIAGMVVTTQSTESARQLAHVAAGLL